MADIKHFCDRELNEKCRVHVGSDEWIEGEKLSVDTFRRSDNSRVIPVSYWTKTMDSEEATRFEKATIYTVSEFTGMVTRTEVRSGKAYIGRYAQYEKAVRVSFIPKGKRTLRAFARGSRPYVLILEGHGHPEPESFTEPVEGDQVTITRSRYTSCDPRFVTDFIEMISSYLVENSITPVFSRVDDSYYV